MRELDVLLMRYMDERFAQAPKPEQAAFEALLELQDTEIHGLLTGRLGTDDPGLADVVERLLP